MADVEMTDASTGTKTSREGPAADTVGDGKKRFEVKKARLFATNLCTMDADIGELVERCSSLGLGYRGPQLRHLP